MKFSINEKIFEKFPSLLVGIIIVENADNSGTALGVLQELRKAEAKVRLDFNEKVLSENPKISAWRLAYSVFGAKPKDFKSSVESLCKTVLEGKSLRHINKLVDVYNLVSLKHLLPVGGEDLDKVKDFVVLDFAQENEVSVLLLGDKEARPPHVGEVVYRDSVSVICRRWNWREADRTKLTENTKNCILVIEALAPTIKEELKNAVEELARLVEKYCGAKTRVEILDKDRKEMEV